MIIKGFKFGMLLQIAIGPICLFVFQTAVTYGFPVAISAVIGVTLVDAFFILAAIWGLGTLLNRNKDFKNILQTLGAIVLIGFGISTIAAAFGISIIPNINLLSTKNIDSIFTKSIILTLSNPLTIIFWAGVFSAKIVEEEMNSIDMYIFGFGAIVSTFFFLTFVSVFGHFVNEFIPVTLLVILNIIIGIVLIVFGIKTALKKA